MALLTAPSCAVLTALLATVTGLVGLAVAVLKLRPLGKVRRHRHRPAGAWEPKDRQAED